MPSVAPPPPLPLSSRAAFEASRRAAAPRKHVRRSATTVCAGYFDESGTPPRVTMASRPSVLVGVENLAWARTGRDGAPEKPVKLARGPSSLVTAHGAFSGASRSAHTSAQSEAHWPAYSSNSARFGAPGADPELDDLYSADEADDFDPVGPIPSSPRPLSEASSVLSFDSIRRPLTPFGSEGTSPTTTVSPGVTRDGHDYPLTSKDWYGVTEVASLRELERSHGRVRPRAGSAASSDTDVPLAKRPKTHRSKTSTSTAFPDDDAEDAQDSSALADGRTLIRDSLGRVRPTRRKSTTRKGWKGWVEVEDTGVEPVTLIKLDAPATIIPERRTRSGRNFDG